MFSLSKNVLRLTRLKLWSLYQIALHRNKEQNVALNHASMNFFGSVWDKTSTMLLCVQLRYVNMVRRAILVYPSGFNRSSNRDHLPSLSWKESPSSSCPIALPCSSWTYRNEYKRIVPATQIGGLSRDVRTRPRSNWQFYLGNFTRTHMLSFPMRSW